MEWFRFCITKKCMIFYDFPSYARIKLPMSNIHKKKQIYFPYTRSNSHAKTSHKFAITQPSKHGKPTNLLRATVAELLGVYFVCTRSISRRAEPSVAYGGFAPWPLGCPPSAKRITPFTPSLSYIQHSSASHWKTFKG